MQQNYFIVVLAHSLHGRLRRIHIPHSMIYGVFLLAMFGLFSAFGIVSSYARMAWKVANYNSLQREADSLRARYQNLQETVNQTNEQLATLEMFASEVSSAYGIKQKLEGTNDLATEARLVPTLSETIKEYNFLRGSNFSRYGRGFKGFNSYAHRASAVPALWPVDGRLVSSYGSRSDPFNGEGAYHTGVDISSTFGTVVHAAADGIVERTERAGGYGLLVVIDHGNGYQTYYGHLSQSDVMEGQEIRTGEVVGRVGTSGRSTGPHLHYEVRVGRAPVNPYHFLTRSLIVRQAKAELPF